MHTGLLILLIILLIGGLSLAAELLFIGIAVFLVCALFGVVTAPVGGGTILLLLLVVLLLRRR